MYPRTPPDDLLIHNAYLERPCSGFSLSNFNTCTVRFQCVRYIVILTKRVWNIRTAIPLQALGEHMSQNSSFMCLVTHAILMQVHSCTHNGKESLDLGNDSLNSQTAELNRTCILLNTAYLNGLAFSRLL